MKRAPRRYATYSRSGWGELGRIAAPTVGRATRADGTHALRHYYASALLEGGVSIKALSEYLGHVDPGFTLRTYTHLMPASHDRTRRVIDSRTSRSDGLRAC